MIQATIAVYPFHQEDWGAVEAALVAMRNTGVEVVTRSMLSEVLGSPDAVFAAIRAAFDAAAGAGAVVVNASISNSCPLPTV